MHTVSVIRIEPPWVFFSANFRPRKPKLTHNVRFDSDIKFSKFPENLKMLYLFYMKIATSYREIRMKPNLTCLF